ncbi:MAG: asparagine synthase (glutamine-hydrolyzing) [Burkholderiales bacterium]
MCGIAGILNLRPGTVPPPRDALISMGSALFHRGPDEFGIYRDHSVGLAHARLSIVDLSTGQQPLANEDETLWIVFNGEIFNHIELRVELERLGHRFRTRSDTEVIVHAYEAWGENAFARMNGQWAVALWDSVKRRLVLSRDRLGVRPLYVCEHGGKLYFASEVKAIFAAGASIPRLLDPAGIDQTFTFWSVVPPQTVFRGIEELRPAHVRVYENGITRERAYWQAQYPEEPDRSGEFEGSVEDAVQAVRSALEKATSLRMLRSDVPVGSYLSGGLDSSLIAAYAARCAGPRFQTFSLGFDEPEYDETAFQQLVANQIGSEHHQVVVKRKDIADVFPDVIYHTERPILRTAPAPLFLLSRLVREHGIKVVLTGEGADETFAGYDLFREGKVRRFWATCPTSGLRPRLLERLYPYLARSPVAQQAMARQFFGRDLAAYNSPGFAHSTRWQGTSALKRLLSPPMREAVDDRDAVRNFLGTLPEAFTRWTPLAQDQYIENRTLLSGYLLSSQGDRMLMANSVEGRFPFLDREVVELADSLPPRYKLRVLDEKHVLKRAAQGVVPDAVLRRKKQPYRAPDALCFVGADVPEYVHELLQERCIADAGVFDPKAVGQLWKKCQAHGGIAQFSNADNMALVGVLSTQLLHHQYVCHRPSAKRRIGLSTDIDRLQTTTADV